MSGPEKKIDEAAGPAAPTQKAAEHENAEAVHATDVPAAQAGTIDAEGMLRLQQTAGNAGGELADGGVRPHAG